MPPARVAQCRARRAMFCPRGSRNVARAIRAMFCPRDSRNVAQLEEVSMLAAVLLAGLIAAPVASVALLGTGVRRVRARGWFHSSRRFVYALIGTAIVAAIAAGGLLLLHVTGTRLSVAIAVLVGATLIWLPITRRWT